MVDAAELKRIPMAIMRSARLDQTRSTPLTATGVTTACACSGNVTARLCEHRSDPYPKMNCDWTFIVIVVVNLLCVVDVVIVIYWDFGD